MAMVQTISLYSRRNDRRRRAKVTDSVRQNNVILVTTRSVGGDSLKALN